MSHLYKNVKTALKEEMTKAEMRPSCWTQLAGVKKPPRFNLYSLIRMLNAVGGIKSFESMNFKQIIIVNGNLLNGRQPEVEGNHCLWDAKLSRSHPGVQVGAAYKRFLKKKKIFA